MPATVATSSGQISPLQFGGRETLHSCVHPSCANSWTRQRPSSVLGSWTLCFNCTAVCVAVFPFVQIIHYTDAICRSTQGLWNALSQVAERSCSKYSLLFGVAIMWGIDVLSFFTSHPWIRFLKFWCVFCVEPLFCWNYLRANRLDALCARGIEILR